MPDGDEAPAMTNRTRVRARRGVLAIVAGVIISWCALASSAWAVPGVPAAPTTIYAEDFENGSGLTELESYVADSGVGYSADSYWLNQRRCNGFILAYSDTTYPGATYCNSNPGFWPPLRRLTYALGLLNSPQNAQTNRAVATITTGNADNTANFDADGPLTPMVQFRGVGQLGLPSASGRFVTFSVDAAATSCGTPPRLRFYLRDAAGTELPVSTSPINPCNDPGRQTANIEGTAISYGSFAGDGSILLTSPSLGIVMRNETPTSSGNDGAFDNIRVLDVTPTLDKSFGPAEVNVGAPSTLTFTITNTSELAAKNGWSFTDTLPAGLVVADPASASTTCSGGQATAAAGGGSVAVSGNLNAGQVSCTVSVNVTSATRGTYNNCPGNVALVGLNPPACASVTFRSADVEIFKSTSAPVVPGEQATYSLVVSNHGPDAANNVAASDRLPAGVSFVSASPECGEAAGTVTCAIASLAAGASQTFTVTAAVDAGAECSELANTATVTSATHDPDASNNSALVRNCERRANHSITKIASAARVPTGGQLMYTLVVKNHGPGDDGDVTVTDPIPAGLSLVSAKPSQGTCATTQGRVSCELGDLNAGGSAQVLVTAQMTATSGCVTNTATVAGDVFDPAPDDNRASAEVCVEVPPPPPPATTFDLQVDKRADASRVTVGQRVSYRIVVRNNGPGAAPDVRVTDTFNRRATVLSVRATQGSCTRRIPIACELGRIDAGASATITVVIRPRDIGRARNAASATSCCGTDATPGDNLETADIRVRRVVLRLSKVASTSTVRAGQTLSYRIRLMNQTKGQARNVRVCDRLPVGLRYLDSKPKAKVIGRRRCWTIRRLGAGKRRTFRVTVRAAGGANGRKINTATATSPDATSVTAREPVQVRGLATPVTG